VALVAADLDDACALLEAALGVGRPFHDEGVGAFGLANAVYELGDTFVEIVAPVADGTTAGRYLTRRGGDAGYMAIVQVPDTAAARVRVAGAGVRVVWQIDLPDIAGTHLHPGDVPGAIVSLDTPLVPETWRWGGPRWTDGVPPVGDRSAASIAGIVVRLVDLDAGAARWAEVLGLPIDGHGLALAAGAQRVAFEPAAGPTDEGIAEVLLAGGGADLDVTVCGVRFRSS
jgi:hypothetical protein